MNGLLSAITSMRDESRHRLRLDRTRDEMHKLDGDRQKMQRGTNAIVEIDDQ